MADTYKAVFMCPHYEEREVWYVSNKRAADMMLARHIKTHGTNRLQKRYEGVEYTFTITPVFISTGDAGYDPRG